MRRNRIAVFRHNNEMNTRERKNPFELKEYFGTRTNIHKLNMNKFRFNLEMGSEPSCLSDLEKVFSLKIIQTKRT